MTAPTTDPELTAMERIWHILSEFDSPTQNRMLDYLQHRVARLEFPQPEPRKAGYSDGVSGLPYGTHPLHTSYEAAYGAGFIEGTADRDETKSWRSK